MRLNDGLSDDEMRICDRLAGWAWAIILSFDLSIVLVLLYSYLAPHPRPVVVSIWTWTTFIGAAVGLCALLIWLSRQPAFGQPRERPTNEPSASN
jgi:O-antigen/teichoic acid export membrane protein